MLRVTLFTLWITFQLPFVFSEDLYETLFGTSPRRDLNFTELAKYDGYETETHSVTTSDGYILGVYRLPLMSNCTSDQTKVPIIFMHGLYLTGDDCLIPGPGKAHCYIYADSCYDVWVPNVRGNRYSRNHTTLDPDKDSEFWDYAFDQLALYDLPAIIDYVLDQTNQTQVAYVSHAQGASMLLLLCAKKPEYNAKIKVGIGMSTTAWLDNSRFVVLELEETLVPLLTAATLVGVNMEVLAYGGVTQSMIELFCGLSDVSYPVCSLFIFAVLGYNEYQITDDVLKVITGHVPGGTSLKNFNRWGQIKQNGFTEYDYGTIANLLAYGQTSPPEFDLSPVTMEWILIGSENDYVSDPKDLATLDSKLSNSTVCIVSDETFGHLDFVYGKDINTLITPMVLARLETGSFECL